MHAIIRTIETARFRVVVDALPEDWPVDVDDDGETAAAVERGDLVHFIARARAIHRPTGIELGADYLGGCIYESLEQFRRDPYCRDLIREAVTYARNNLANLRDV